MFGFGMPELVVMLVIALFPRQVRGQIIGRVALSGKPISR